MFPAFLVLSFSVLHHTGMADDYSPLLNLALGKLAELDKEARTLEQKGTMLSSEREHKHSEPAHRQHRGTCFRVRTVEVQEKTLGMLRVAAAKAAAKGSASSSSERASDRCSSEPSRHD